MVTNGQWLGAELEPDADCSTAALQRMKSKLSKCDIEFWIFNSVLKRSLKFESKSTIWQARRKRWWKGHIQILLILMYMSINVIIG